MGFNTDVWKELKTLKSNTNQFSKKQINTIVTHEFPDLDCLYSIYLLKNFGEKYYEGISKAELVFIPAGTRYLGKNWEDLLNEGIITVDMEGGLFDHHLTDVPIEQELSTASLVARGLGMAENDNIRKMLKFINKNDIYGTGIQSRFPEDHLIALPNLLKGLNAMYGPDYQKVYRICQELFHAAYEIEAQWFQSLKDVDQGVKFSINKQFKVLAFKSDTITSAKAARYKKGNLCVIQGKNDTLNVISHKQKAFWPRPDLTPIARVVRLAEAVKVGKEVDHDQLGKVGSFVDWFLHESLTFVSHGSFKKTDIPASPLSLDDVFNLIIFCFIPDRKYLKDLQKHHDLFLKVLGDPMKAPGTNQADG